MKIYEIDKEIESMLAEAVDTETGEILFDPERLEELQMERDRKIENLALAVKNLTAEAAAIKAEKDALAERQKATEKAADKARQYLEYVLNGESFKTAKCSVTWRKTKRVEIDPAFVSWAISEGMDDLLRRKPAEPDKGAIGDLLKSGVEVPYAALVETTNMTIK